MSILTNHNKNSIIPRQKRVSDTQNTCQNAKFVICASIFNRTFTRFKQMPMAIAMKTIRYKKNALTSDLPGAQALDWTTCLQRAGHIKTHVHVYYTTAFHLFTSSNYSSVMMPPTCIRGKRFAVVLPLYWKMMGQCLHKNHNLLYYPLPTHHRKHSHTSSSLNSIFS